MGRLFFLDAATSMICAIGHFSFNLTHYRREVRLAILLSIGIILGDVNGVNMSRTTWYVAITTAPRDQPTLAATMESIHAAGWYAPFVFAEPGVLLAEVPGLCTVLQNAESLGPWANFLKALHWGLDNTYAEFLAVVQDDIDVARGLRRYLEETMPRGESVGAISPYTNTALQGRLAEVGLTERWNRIPDERVDAGNGACFIVMPRHSAVLLQKTPIRNTGRNGPDRWVGKHCRQQGLSFHYHRPSLVQHVGTTSTINPGKTMNIWRRADDFVSEIIV